MTYHERTVPDGDTTIMKRILFTGSLDSTVIAWEWLPDVSYRYIYVLLSFNIMQSRYSLKCKYSNHKAGITTMLAKNSSIYSMRYDVLYIAGVDGTIRAIDLDVSNHTIVLKHA